jgi:membrane protease YdiL (CAAX protease family)
LIALLLEEYTLKGALLLFGAFEAHNLIAGALYRPVKKCYPRKSVLKEKNEADQDKVEVVLNSSDKSETLQSQATPDEMQTLNREENNPGPDEIEGQIAENDKKVKEEKENIPQKKVGVLTQLKVVTNWKFMLYGWQIICMAASVQTFFTFLPAYAEELGSGKMQGALLLSILGIADMSGRLFFSAFFDLKIVRNKIGRRNFHSSLGFIMGLLAFVAGFTNLYVTIAIVGVLWGLFEGVFHGQRTTVISDIVPPEQMSSATGFVILFQGVGNLFGPAVAGELYLRA